MDRTEPPRKLLTDALAAALATAMAHGSSQATRGTPPRPDAAARAHAAAVRLASTLSSAALPSLMMHTRRAAIEGLGLLVDLYATTQAAPRPTPAAAQTQADTLPDAANAGSSLAPDDDFIARARGFCSAQRRIAEAAGATYSGPRAIPMLVGPDGQLAPPPAGHTLPSMRASAEQGLLAELDAALGPCLIPNRFLRLFQQNGPGSTAWFDTFALYLAAEIDAEPPLRHALDRATAAAAPGCVDALLSLGRQTAARFDRHLKTAQSRHDAAPQICEATDHVQRLPAILADLHALPEPALRRLVSSLGGGRLDHRSIETRLQPALALLRLAGTFAQAPPLRGLAALRDEANAHIAAGRFEFAASILETGEARADKSSMATANSDVQGQTARLAAAELAWARGLCLGLAGDFGAARQHIARSLDTLDGAEGRFRRRYRLTLGLTLAHHGGGRERREAIALLAEIATEEAIGDALQVSVPATLGLGQAVLRLKQPQRQLKSLTLAAHILRRTALTAVPILPARTHAEIWHLFAEVCLSLARLGAERDADIAEALTQGARLARLAGDARLAAICNSGRAQAASRQPDADGTQTESRARTILERLVEAQAPGLRLRDPLLWADIKLQIGEALVARAADHGSGDAGNGILLAAIISTKAALRLFRPEIDAAAHCRAATTLADAYVGLAHSDRRNAWKRLARQSLRLALTGLSPHETPILWADTHMRLAGDLTRGALEEQELPQIEEAIVHLRQAAEAVEPSTSRWVQARRQLGEAMAEAGRRRFDVERLEEASTILRGTLSETMDEAMPILAVQCRIALCNAERELARLTDSTGPLSQALLALDDTEPRLAAHGPNWLLQHVRNAQRDARRMLSQLAPAQATRTGRTTPPPLKRISRA